MINRVLGLAALVLGGSAVLVPSARVTDLDRGIGPIPSHHDGIPADSLATRIMEKGTAGLTLVDLRSQAAFEAYHIPGAVRLNTTDLNHAQLSAGSTVVLYDDAELSAPRVWLLLKAQGYPEVYVLSGGLAAWNEDVLHPALPPGVGHAAEDEFARQLERSRFFGGSPAPAATRRTPTQRPQPESTRTKKETFDIGPGGCFY